MDTPAKLLLEQGPMLKTLGRIAAKTAIPLGKKVTENPSSFSTISEELPSPSKELIANYSRWAGVKDSKYSECLPPHMFTQFALPVCSRQIEMTRYNIGGIINQGCGMTIYGKLPVGQPIHVTSEVVKIEEDNGRARLHQKLAVSSASGTKAVDVDFYTAFIIGKGVKKKREEKEPVEFESLGSWDTTSNDGLEFGILTGDLNPIHWIAPIAKMSAFKGKVLHGFGMFVRSFELIQNTTQKEVAAIDVRFISPVKLPSSGNEVWQSVLTDESGNHQLELRDSSGKIQMIGSYR